MTLPQGPCSLPGTAPAAPPSARDNCGLLMERASHTPTTFTLAKFPLRHWMASFPINWLRTLVPLAWLLEKVGRLTGETSEHLPDEWHKCERGRRWGPITLTSRHQHFLELAWDLRSKLHGAPTFSVPQQSGTGYTRQTSPPVPVRGCVILAEGIRAPAPWCQVVGRSYPWPSCYDAAMVTITM